MSKSTDHYLALTPIQINAIQSMFRFYDLDLHGKITKERAQKILQRLGVDNTALTLHSQVTLKDLLEYVDHHLPDPDPPLASELTGFIKLVARPEEEPGPMHTEKVGAENRPSTSEGAPATANAFAPVYIKPQYIIDFFEATDQPVPNSTGVVSHMMTAMLDWDDCSEVPAVTPAVFVRDLSKFAKKSNALREFV